MGVPPPPPPEAYPRPLRPINAVIASIPKPEIEIRMIKPGDRVEPDAPEKLELPICGDVGCNQRLLTARGIAGHVNGKPYCHSCWRKHKTAQLHKERADAVKTVTDTLDKMVTEVCVGGEIPELVKPFFDFVAKVKSRTRGVKETSFRQAFIGFVKRLCRDHAGARKIFLKYGDDFPEQYHPKKYMKGILEGMNVKAIVGKKT